MLSRCCRGCRAGRRVVSCDLRIASATGLLPKIATTPPTHTAHTPSEPSNRTYYASTALKRPSLVVTTHSLPTAPSHQSSHCAIASLNLIDPHDAPSLLVAICARLLRLGLPRRVPLPPPPPLFFSSTLSSPSPWANPHCAPFLQLPLAKVLAQHRLVVMRPLLLRHLLRRRLTLTLITTIVLRLSSCSLLPSGSWG